MVSARAGSFIRPEGLIFYAGYLLVFWPLLYFMYQRLSSVPDDRHRQKTNRWLLLANVFLAFGDTLALIGYSLGQFKIVGTDGYGTFTFAGITQQTAILGVIATSLTMSCYYLFLALYYRDKFHEGQNDTLMWIIYVLFIARILLHFNPSNVWFISLLPKGTPNYSAWIRNAPLFVYGLLATLLIGWKAYQMNVSSEDANQTQYRKNILLAVLAILFSYFFYALDIFFAHLLPLEVIGLAYVLKTIAYVAAAVFMFRAEFRQPF